MPPMYQGIYVGASGGLVNTYGKITSASRARYIFEIDPSLSLNTKKRATQNKGSIGIDIGYSWLCDIFYLGGELGFYYAKGELHEKGKSSVKAFDSENEQGYSASLSLKSQAKLRNFEWTLDFTPGVILCDSFLFYGRIGAALNRAQLNAATKFCYQDFEFSENVHQKTSHLCLNNPKKQGALRLGFGFSHYITDDLVLNANYVYTNYGTVRVSGISHISTIDNGPTSNPRNQRSHSELDASSSLPNALSSQPETDEREFLISETKVNVRRQSLMIGLNYYFDCF